MAIIIIEFASDLQTGNRPVLDHLNNLRTLVQAKDADASWILPRIVRALDFTRRHGVPGSLNRQLMDVDDVGAPFTLTEPVKALKHHPPIHELRVNKKDRGGAFRALFFPYPFEGDQILVFTRSVMKQDTSDQDFDIAVSETEAMLPDFLNDPSKYINL